MREDRKRDGRPYAARGTDQKGEFVVSVLYHRADASKCNVELTRRGWAGWHVLWPDDHFYMPREMRLLIWTFQDAEPWDEVVLSPQAITC